MNRDSESVFEFDVDQVGGGCRRGAARESEDQTLGLRQVIFQHGISQSTCFVYFKYSDVSLLLFNAEHLYNRAAPSHTSQIPTRFVAASAWFVLHPQEGLYDSI